MAYLSYKPKQLPGTQKRGGKFFVVMAEGRYDYGYIYFFPKSYHDWRTKYFREPLVAITETSCIFEIFKDLLIHYVN